MGVVETIERTRTERGMSVAELSRRTGIEYENLRVSLKGERKIPAPEFVKLCRQLDLRVEDFD